MSFIDTLTERLAERPDAAAVVEMTANGPVNTTGAQMLDLIARGRGALEARGIAPGDRVVLVGPNRARWAAADLAILGHGAVCVPMYDRQAAHELVAMMRDCGAKLVVVADDALSVDIEAADPGAPVVTWDTFFAAPATDARPLPREDGDLVTLIYTSGTSGEPKGVMLTAGNVAHMLPMTSNALTELMAGAGGDERIFHYLPFCFAGSRVVLWTALFRGRGIRVSVDLDRLIDEIGEAAPHYFLNVPVLLERVKNGAEKALRAKGSAIWWLYRRALQAYAAEAPGRRDRLALAVADRLLFAPVKAKLGPNIRFLICGSAPLGEDTQRWFEMLGVPVYQVYGLTETTAIVTMDKKDRVVAGRVGYAIDGCETKLTDEGELLVRGPHIFSGYWNKPEHTEGAFVDGWFRTGDQCVVDDDGNWAVIGRVKNLLVPSSGHNVAPEPIEQKLTERIPGVEQAVLIGHARPYLTAILTGELRTDEVEAAVEAVNAGLPHYKRVRRWHVRPAPMTDAEGLLTANGKLRRAVIESHFSSEIEAMYA
jgi:long-chain acyl-CoA synthetase